MGICNGFQILCEWSSPGADAQRSQHYICKQPYANRNERFSFYAWAVSRDRTTDAIADRKQLFCDSDTLQTLNKQGSIAFDTRLARVQ